MRRIALVLPLISAAVLSAQTPVGPETPVLSVSRVILYKSGIGYFEHLSRVTGNQTLAVQFTGDQLDDVLKSLTAVDLGDGRFTGISYDSPTPTARRLQALRVPLTQKANALGLLDALRGSRLEIRTGGSVVAGRLLSVERRTRSITDKPVERDELTLITDAGDILTIGFDDTTRVRVADADLRQDVNRYLDITASDGDRSPRRVTLSTAGTGQRQVMVSYVGEAAVWKTTYRLVFPTTGPREPVLQGWAIVDNMSASDWDDVELSLVAGAPQAFRQPLAVPLFATRPLIPLTTTSGVAPMTHSAALIRNTASISGVVRDNSGAALPGARIVVTDQARNVLGTAVADALGRYSIEGLTTGPAELRVELVGFNPLSLSIDLQANGTQRDIVLGVGTLSERVTVTGDAGTGRAFSGVAGGRAAPPPPPPAASPALIEQRTLDQVIAANASQLGELFEYRLKDRVTIKRNQSALVPILQSAVSAERISLWNAAMGTRPRRAVWLTNTSDLTLDGGSIAIVDAGAFAGEGLIESIKPGERRLVSFAADIGVQVAATARPGPQRITRIRIAEGTLTQHSEQRQRRTYTLRNDNRDARTVIVEHPARPDWKLAGAVTPIESTASVHRFRVAVAPAETATLDVEEARVESTTFGLLELDRDRLVVIAQGDANREALERTMAPVFAKRAELDRIDSDIRQRQSEVAAITSDQDRVRQNIAALRGASSERQLMERYTRQLDQQETRLETLNREIKALNDSRARTEHELGQLIMAVSVDLAM